MNARVEVVHGGPTDEELAVVVSLLSAAASVPGEQPAPETSNWARPAMRITHHADPGAWWRSGLPRP